jgi:hypothetical protein
MSQCITSTTIIIKRRITEKTDSMMPIVLPMCTPEGGSKSYREGNLAKP